MAKSSSGERKVPPQVKRAIIEGDTVTLSCLGRVGGLKAAKVRAQKKADAEFWAELHRSEIMADATKQAERPEVRVGWDDDYNP